MASYIYWVKENRPLFGKREWTVTLGDVLIAYHKQRQEAVEEALNEAERTSLLGRQTEVWIDDGHGFILEKAFKASKPPADEEGDEDGDGADEERAGDDSIGL